MTQTKRTRPGSNRTAPVHSLGRRALLRRGVLWLAGTTVGVPAMLKAGEPSPGGRGAARIGLLTDVHYADLDTAGARHYRDSLAKVRAAVARFKQAGVDFAVELGDLIDAAPQLPQEIGHLQTIDAEFAAVGCPRHYVLGNHCVYSLTKQEFLAHSAATQTCYAFDAGGLHFVVLDACFRHDGQPYGRRNFEWTDANIPADQLKWLAKDLREAARKTVVFIHQRLDVADHYGVKNAPAVRKVLAQSGNVVAVFQGHNHMNDYKEIDTIHYVTLTAVVEGAGVTSNAFALVDLFPDGSLRVDGFRRQKDYRLS
jgi:predicted phosphodiesterase